MTKKPNFDVQYFPFYISRWRDSESRLNLTLEQRGLYLELLFVCYRAGSLPNDRQTLGKLAGITEKEFDRCWKKVKGMFIEDGGRLHHHVVDQIIPSLEDKREKRAKAGAEGGRAKSSNARAMLEQKDSNALPSEQSKEEVEKRREKSSANGATPPPLSDAELDAEFAEPDRQQIAWRMVEELKPPVHWGPCNIPAARAAAERIMAGAMVPDAVCASIRENHAQQKRWIELNPRERKKALQFWLADGDYLSAAPEVGKLATSADGW